MAIRLEQKRKSTQEKQPDSHQSYTSSYNNSDSRKNSRQQNSYQVAMAEEIKEEEDEEHELSEPSNSAKPRPYLNQSNSDQSGGGHKGLRPI